MWNLGMGGMPPQMPAPPQLANPSGAFGTPVQQTPIGGPIAQPSRIPGGIMAALQNPEIQQLIMGQLGGQQERPQIQAPGLLMPNPQITPFQMAPLTAAPSLFGGR